MPTEEIYKGPRFEIRSWIEDGVNIVLDFVEKLEKNGDKDARRLNALMIRTADNGVTRNEAQIRSLGNDIYEFKAQNTGRIMFFYDKNRLIICAHGFTGKKGSENKHIKKQIEKAMEVRRDYFREKGE
jgi:hypothetical protein